MKRIALFIFYLFLVIACSKSDSLKPIKDNDFRMIERGSYRGRAVFLRDGAVYKDMVDEYRSDIAKQRILLPQITRHIFDVPNTLVYKFKYASIDSHAGFLILRYFSRIYDHPLLAGYQIQFVFDMQSSELSKVFVDEVPLE